MKNVIIMGSGRSGTSMLAGTLAGNGYYIGGEQIRPNESNPKGFFESHEINLVNERILERIVATRPPIIGYLSRYIPAFSGRWKGEMPVRGLSQLWLACVSHDAEMTSNPSIDRKIQKLTGRKPFCFKDPRFCYTLPVWRPFLDENDIVYLCVFRNPADTIDSILRECAGRSYLSTLEMNPERAFSIWHAMYTHVLRKHRLQGDWMFLHFDQMFDPDCQQALENFIGAPIDRRFPDGALRRSRGTYRLDAATKAVFLKLCRLAKYEPIEE